MRRSLIADRRAVGAGGRPDGGAGPGCQHACPRTHHAAGAGPPEPAVHRLHGGLQREVPGGAPGRHRGHGGRRPERAGRPTPRPASRRTTWTSWTSSRSATRVQPYMTGATPPSWQTLVDAGPAAGPDRPAVRRQLRPGRDRRLPAPTTTRSTQINLGRVGFSGIYLNKDLFAAHGVAVPTTWSELVAACPTFTAADVPCMTAGGKDGWPIFVDALRPRGLCVPRSAAYVQGLWDGSIKYTDEAGLAMSEQLRVLDQDMIEPGASGLAARRCPRAVRVR